MADATKKVLMRNPGVLSLVISDNEEERDALRVYIGRNQDFAYLDYISFAAEGGDPDFFFKFLDMFGGKTIEVPKREEVLRDIQHVRIYLFVKKKGYSEAVYKMVSGLFKKKESAIKGIVEKVGKVLEARD